MLRVTVTVRFKTLEDADLLAIQDAIAEAIEEFCPDLLDVEVRITDPKLPEGG